MTREGHTLQPTVLVHEAWMRLGGHDAMDWKSRAHFFGAAGEALTRLEQHDERLASVSSRQPRRPAPAAPPPGT